MRAMLSKIGRGLKSFGQFFAALGHTEKQASAPDPRKAVARRLRESMHSNRVSTANAPNAEQLYAKEFSKGYKEQPR